MGYPRTRSTGYITAPSLARSQVGTYYDGRVSGPTVVSIAPPLRFQETMYDIVTPGYQSLVNRGVIINNPMTHVRTSAVHTDCSFTDTYNTQPYGAFNDQWVHSGVCVPRQTPQAMPSVTTNCGDKAAGAINRAYADVNEGTAQLLVDIAELSKTYTMLKNPFREALNLVRKTRKVLSGKTLRAMIARGKKVYGGTRLPDAASGVYLEWRYGWNPLLRSIDDTCHAIAENMNQTKRRFTGRGYASGEDHQSKSAVSYWNPLSCSNGGMKNEAITDKSQRVTWRAGVLAEGYLSSASNLGVSFADVPSTAWELVPYSFVVDWFVGVGDWISAHRPTPGFSYLASWLTVLDESTTTYTFHYHAGSCSVGTGSSLRSYQRSQGTCSLTNTSWSKSRTVGVSPSVFPQSDLDFRSLTHLVDGIALTYQRFGR